MKKLLARRDRLCYKIYIKILLKNKETGRKNRMKKNFLALFLLAALLMTAAVMPANAAELYEAEDAAIVEMEDETDNRTKILSSKAWAATVLIGIACVAGAMGMAWSIMKTSGNIAKQPEAAGSLRTTMMLGLVFIETIVIYALIVAILIIFVL